jgi:hypothetical protein
VRRRTSLAGHALKRFVPGRFGAVQHCAMNTTRRGLAATALPLLMLGAGLRAASAKSAGPLMPDACTPGAPSKACAEAKARFVADGGQDAPGCPHCAAASKDSR